MKISRGAPTNFNGNLIVPLLFIYLIVLALLPCIHHFENIHEADSIAPVSSSWLKSASGYPCVQLVAEERVLYPPPLSSISIL